MRTLALMIVSGSSQHEISATVSVAKPIAPMMPGMVTPAASSPVATATTSTMIAALMILLAAMTRDRPSAGLLVCRIA